MIFPRGEVRHQNLLTAFTNLSALISTLNLEGFSGMVEAEFPNQSGAIFIRTGEVINAEVKNKDGTKRTTGQEALEMLLSLSTQKDGILQVYQFQPEQVAIVAKNLQYEMVFQGLSTDFTRMDRLLIKLKEEGHHGFIEILTKENRPLGVLFLEEGEPIELFITPESGPSIFGRKSIPTLVESANKQGLIFNVYKTPGEVSPIVSKEIPNELPKEPTKDAPKEVLKEERLIRKGGKDLEEVISILQDLLFNLEKIADSLIHKGGTFRRAFKKSLVERAEEFPFLDPFGGEFEYREGEIRFTGEVELREFWKGVIQTLQTTLSRLEEEFPKNKMLPTKLREELDTRLESFREALKRFGLDLP